MLSSGIFRRETARGFYPWGNVVSPRKRVAEGLCGWRHGNSFPMTQSAQSHRQMRSIPRCPKAVFYVFVFDSIHDSATLHNLSPGMFHWTPKKQITFDFFVLCHTFDEWIWINNYVTIIYTCKKKSRISKIWKIDGAIKIKRGGTLVVLPLLVIGCKVLCYFTLNTFFVTARVPSV